MRTYAPKILVVVIFLGVIYFFWGADIRNFLIERGVVDIPTLFVFLYGLILWTLEKIIYFFDFSVGYILKVFSNILSNLNKILDLFLSLIGLIKKIFS